MKKIINLIKNKSISAKILKENRGSFDNLKLYDEGKINISTDKLQRNYRTAQKSLSKKFSN
jgi:hypothetical protein